MKTAPLILSALLCIFSAAANAHGIPGNAPPGYNDQVRYNQDEIWDSYCAIHRSHHAIAAEKRNLAYDKEIARIEALEARDVQRRQDQLIAQGDYRGARKLEKVRRHEANQAAIARRHVSHDRNVIAIERRQIDHHRNVIAINRRG